MGFTALKRVEVLQIMQHESNIDRFLSISNISTKSLWKRIDPNKEIENKFQVPWEKNSTERRDTGKRVAINSSAPSFSPAQGRYQGRFLCDQSVFRPWHSTLLPEDSSVAISGHSHWFKGVFFLKGSTHFFDCATLVQGSLEGYLRVSGFLPWDSVLKRSSECLEGILECIF